MMYFWALVGAMAIMFFVKRFVENAINYFFLSEKKNHFDTNNQHQGIVLNRATGKLEADNSLIKPL